MRRHLLILGGCLVLSPCAQAKVIEFQRVLDCGDLTSAQCTQKVLAGLETPTLKLHADLSTDTVHGSVSISFADPPAPSTIRVELYDQDDLPTDTVLANGKLKHLRDPGSVGAHRSTLKRPLVMPADQDVKDKLAAVVTP